MTSPASSQNVPAPNATAPPATASYASAAGASGKVAATPVIASGSAPIVSSSPVVVGSAAAAPAVPAVPSAHNGNVPAVPSPLNGSDSKNKSAKPNSGSSVNMSGASNPAAPAAAKPIVPAVPAVINGSSTAKDHARKSSVTISAAGPSAKAGPPKPIKFGFDSPSIAHSTPQAPTAPVAIPGSTRIPSPDHLPSPIPQSSGGRPPVSISQEGTTMKFGSLGDGDRPMKHTPNMPASNLYPAGSQSPHFRRGSTHSAHSDIGNNPMPSNGAGPHGHNGPNHGNHGHHGGPGGPGRGGYGPQGGRGRGGYNHQYNNQAMGFSPGGGGYRGPSGQGRGGMPPQFQPRAANFGANSPQASRASPSIPPAMPNNGTPQMLPVVPANQIMNPAYYGYNYPPSAGLPPQVNVNTAPPHPSTNNYSRYDHPHHGPPPFKGGNRKKGSRGGGGNGTINAGAGRGGGGGGGGGGGDGGNKSKGGGAEKPFSLPPRSLESASKCTGQQQQTEHRKGAGSRRNSKRWTESTALKAGSIESTQWTNTAAANSAGSLAAEDSNTRPSASATSGRLTTVDEHKQGPGPVSFGPYQRGLVGSTRLVDDLSPASGNFERLLTKTQQNYQQPYGQQFSPQGAMGYPAYNQMNPYVSGPPKAQNPVFVPGYAPPYGPPAPAMSRNSSQAASERPGSSTGPAATPVAPALAATSSATGSVSGSKISGAAPSFQLPRKKAAIVIKNPQGETLDFNNIKAPATPSTSTPDVSRAPSAAAPSAPTPPPKSSTPAPHARAESTTTAKTTEQLRMEFQEKVRKTAGAPVESSADKAKKEAPAAEEKAAAPAAAPAAAVEQKPAPAEAKPAAIVVGKPAAEPAAAAKPAEEAKADATPKAAEAAKTEAPAAAAAAPADADKEEDEMERMIREMEEIEAKREAEEAAFEEERKKKAEAERLAAAPENDRKLREQEREMERLEEERERQRKANEAAAAAGGQTTSVAEMLAARISDITLSERKETTPDALASKLGDMKLADKSSASPTAESASGAAKQQRAKPSALNLAPLNTKAIEPAQPSAALQSLKTAHFLRDPMAIKYPKGIMSPNPALNPAVNKKGNFKYDMGFLLQFKDVFVEKPSLDFDQQVKQLIGDGDASRSGTRTPASSSGSRQNTRGNSSFSTMGAMGSFNSKPLPSGTTSEQRFAMSSGAMPRSTGLPQYNRPAAFPGPSPMARTPSSSLGGPMPNSPRQGSRSARGNSRRDATNPKDAKTMPLTAGQEVKPIAVTASGWKPTSVGNRSASAQTTPSGMLDPPMVQRKVKAALNKMTPENFDRISDQILTIALQSKDEEDGRTLRQVIQLTFEKATDEAHWASMYARFCKRMLDMMSPEIRDVTIKDKKGDVISGGTLFRKYLLNRCQEEFERGWKTDLPQPKEGETKEMVMLSDEYYQAAAAKRRGLGLVQFIGELYKLGMLTERIMHECVRKLVDYESVPDEAEIESLSKLLQTVGANLDNTEKGRPMMDAYFERIKNMIEIPELASRLKFMLMDVVDLRSRRWVSNEVNKGPKTLEEVRLEAEAAAAQKAAEAARTSQRGGGGRGGMGGRDSRQFQYNQPIPNQVGMDDLRRLKGSASRIASSSMGPLGPTSLFASRSNSGRRNGPGGSFGRPGDDSNPASRTGTPPTRADNNSVSHSNAFEALANVDTETPASPPSTAVSPAMAKSNLDKAASK